MRLILCDNHLVFAEALAVALAARGHQVLAVTSTPDTAVEAVRMLEPDICLLDLSFHGQWSGLDAARAISGLHIHTKVVVLSGISDPNALGKTAESPIAGFIRKGQNVDEIARALDVIAAGGIPIEPAPRRSAPSKLARPRLADPMDELTAREREVVGRIVNGESTKHMAEAMSITPDTVRSYVKNILTKLGVHSRLQVSAIASRAKPPADGPAGPSPGQR